MNAKNSLKPHTPANATISNNWECTMTGRLVTSMGCRHEEGIRDQANHHYEEPINAQCEC